MKLRVIIDRAEGVPGAKAAVWLVDVETGQKLPQQRSTILSQRAGELSTITVEFGIDGDTVLMGN